MLILKRTMKILKLNSVIVEKTTCKQVRKMTGSNVWDAENDCTGFVTAREKQQDAEEDLENFVHCRLDY